MLTVRYARPEMRAPIRSWLRANKRTLVGLGVAAAVLVLIGFTQAGRRCGVDSGGAWDCALAGEGLLMLMTLSEAPARSR